MLFAPIGVAGAMGVYRRDDGFWRDGQSGQASRHALRCADCVCAVRAATRSPDARLPIMRFIKSGCGAGDYRFLQRPVRSRPCLGRWSAWKLSAVPRYVLAFVPATGYSFNLDGSTLYLSLACIFVAQAAGIHLTLGQQFIMVFSSCLPAKGVAGVPRAVLVILLGTLILSTCRVACIADLGIDQFMTWHALPQRSWQLPGQRRSGSMEGELSTETPSPAVADAMAQ